MCLDVIYPNKQRNLPKKFTAYKVVHKLRGAYFFPIWHQEDRVQLNNRINTLRQPVRVIKGGKYRPYYHSFRNIAACRAVEFSEPKKYHFIKIEIQKKDVICVGGLGESGKPLYQVIVSKAFTTNFEEIKVKL